ncbi:peptidase inhibitor family I36 protein [Actinopolyspora alba]|uniref:peptidase inhibitor family I36 protein n=1 Tax=Actinopolyspora alba TaxID=673379 RepID=UPI001C315AF3|nr:peptidase inhibitor family I36 protein [Actinopolyspora alba]
MTAGASDCPQYYVCLWVDADYSEAMYKVPGWEDNQWHRLPNWINNKASSYYNNTEGPVTFGAGEGAAWTVAAGKAESDLWAVFGSWNDSITDVKPLV